MPIYGRFPPAVVDYRDVFHSSPVVFFEVQNYGHPYFPHEMRSQRTPKKCDNHMMALYYPHISPLCPHYIPLISATEPDDVGRLESFFYFVAASHGKAKIKADALAMWDEEDFFDDEECRKAPA